MRDGDPILVIGHRRPDLDSIAAAVVYAAFLTDEGRPARAGRPGNLDAQSEWTLERFGIAAPPLVLDVAPTFEAIARAVPPASPDTPLALVVEKLAGDERAVPVVSSDGKPVALIDARHCIRLLGRAAADAREATGAPVGSDTAIRASAIRAEQAVITAGEAAPKTLTFAASERLSERRTAVTRAREDDFLVVSENGMYLGVASRGEILAPPRPRLALVDHNEIGQAVPGAEEAEIVEVLDHHRLGAPATIAPIPFTIDIVGATATLVEERWRASGRPLAPGMAGLLLAAILSDTLAFRSPTTTDRDRAAARRLAELAGIADLRAFGDEVVAAGAGLGRRGGDEIVAEDFKEYEVRAGRLVISQAEVRAMHEVDSRLVDLGEALDRLRDKRGAALAALLLTDPVRGRSRLIARGEPRLVARIPYPHASDGTFDAGTVVSRKKQLVPALLAALE
jgi:manganese-dependent inorganic pyrophosphatase